MRKLIKYLIFLIVILFLSPDQVSAVEKRDSVVVSLITCWPGKEVYELCGHEALRVRGRIDGMPVDSIWNYGVFDFNAPNFVYRFVKGETDYMLVGYPFEWFMPEYVAGNRKVLEQDLNLTDQEATKLVRMLREEGRPENRVYRYNYVRDNCATRIIERLDSVARHPLVFPDSIKYGSFRNEMRAYHRNYPWYQFGIDLALGSGIDIPVTARMEMFVPVEMARKADNAHFADGRPLVKASRILNEGSDQAVLPATPFWLTPLFLGWLLFIVCCGCCYYMIKRRTIVRWIYSVWFGLLGLTGCVITFLVLISSHEATDPNVLILWLNPLQLVLAVTVWSNRLRIVSYIVSYYNIIALTCLLIVWPVQAQSANPAFFPLMGITLMLAIMLAYNGPHVYGVNKNAYKSLNKSGGKSTATSSRKAGRGINKKQNSRK